MKKKISILGSTGSIGVNALNVIKNISQEYEIVHLTGNTNADLMIEQCREFHPKSIVMINEDSSEKVERELMSFSILFLGIVRIRSVFIGEGPIALTVMPNSANSFPRI